MAGGGGRGGKWVECGNLLRGKCVGVVRVAGSVAFNFATSHVSFHALALCERE